MEAAQIMLSIASLAKTGTVMNCACRSVPVNNYESMIAGGTVYSVGAAASSVVSQLFDAKPEITKFASFDAVDRLYARDIKKAPVPAGKSGVLTLLVVPCSEM